MTPKNRLRNYCRHRCPVCWQNVVATRNEAISLHRDSVGHDMCPASWEPFAIAQPYYPQNVYILRANAAAFDNARRSA